MPIVRLCQETHYLRPGLAVLVFGPSVRPCAKRCSASGSLIARRPGPKRSAIRRAWRPALRLACSRGGIDALLPAWCGRGPAAESTQGRYGMRGAGRVVFAATLLLIVGTLNIIYG